MTLPKVFHAKDVKAYLGISLNKTYQILESGELKATKCGSRWLIPETSLIEYLGLDAENDNQIAPVVALEFVDTATGDAGGRYV